MRTGANGDTFLTTGGESPSVVDDDDRDRLFGSVDRDWFLANLDDDQLKVHSGDTVSDLRAGG